MPWYDWFWSIFAWSAAGGLTLIVVNSAQGRGAIGMAKGWEFVNPAHVYKYNYVNWFGAIIVALIYGVLCPIGIEEYIL